MEFDLLGWPPDGPALELDYREFSYAGKFVMTTTGKAVLRDGETIVAAVAFNDDRTDASTLWIRYVTVRRDRRGEGVGSRLIATLRDRANGRGYERLRIAVNNPFAYVALHRAGFAFTGEETGLAELVLEWPGDVTPDRYRRGLRAIRASYRAGERSLTEEERTFLTDALTSDPPDRVAPLAERSNER